MLLFYMLAAELAQNRAPFSYEAIPEFVAGALEQQPAIVELVKRYVFMENCRCRWTRAGLRECV